MHRFNLDFIAMVTYALPAQEGCSSAVHSGYQPVIRFDDCVYTIPAENVLTDRELLSFELNGEVDLVGSGVIKQIVNKNLEKE